MIPRLPLLVFDTNVLMDIWLGRDGNEAMLLLELAEQKRVDLVVPEYVLVEFQGAALRHAQSEKIRLDQQVRPAAKSWLRSEVLGEGADLVQEGIKLLERRLMELKDKVPEVARRITQIARLEQHTPQAHFRGELRHLRGAPPDRPGDGLHDCRIYEAILDIARMDQASSRQKIVVTKDDDFDFPELKVELASLGFTIRKDLGRLYGELRRA